MATITSQEYRPAKSPAFQSVFGSASLKPPKRRQIYQPKPDSYFAELTTSLTEASHMILGIRNDNFRCGSFASRLEICPEMTCVRPPSPHQAAERQQHLADLPLWHQLLDWYKQVGSDQIKKWFALVLHNLLPEFVDWAYAEVYREDSIVHLRFWVEHIFVPYIRCFHQKIPDYEGQQRSISPADVPENTTEKWLEKAMLRLGILRVRELFDIVVNWDKASHGIDELKQCTTNPAARLYVTNKFGNDLTHRLLHPAASTVEILRTYISIIRAFRRLDPKGVLLDRVARLIRRYLRDREDTVRVIVNGLLSDPLEVGEDTEDRETGILRELANELSGKDPHENDYTEGELDWDNMEWMPDPIDAAPDYIKSKGTDIIGSLISLFETKEVFVRELQTTLAERLLRNKSDFEQEVSVLEHLKVRLGDATLQGCEVMLRDVNDSRKVDEVIRKDETNQDNADTGELNLHAKILSRLFWPAMQDQPFKIPEEIKVQQDRYEKGFEDLKQSRKLTWLNSLGQVEVELELEDRSFHEEVLPWQAVVVYAFQSAPPGGSAHAPVIHSVSELADMLEMSPTLVRSACIFWMSRRVLQEVSPDSYGVLERLPEGTDTVMSDQDHQQDASIAALADEAAAQAIKEQEEVHRVEQMAVYRQFIISMLTNQGAMPLPRIAMMLGIVVPGGFPFSNETLKDFLGALVREGTLEIGHGGAYKMAG